MQCIAAQSLRTTVASDCQKPLELHPIWGVPGKSVNATKLAQSEAHAGAQEFLRIDRVAIDACLVVQVWTGGTTGGSNCADHLADANDVADLDADFGQVA